MNKTKILNTKIKKKNYIGPKDVQSYRNAIGSFLFYMANI